MKKITLFLLAIMFFVPVFLPGCGAGGEIEGISVVASCDKQNISLQISSQEGGGSVDVVMLKPYEYFQGEKDRGIYYNTDECAQGEKVGQYCLGTTQTISVERYSQTGEDKMYNKFVLACDGKLVAGPYFVTEITPKRHYDRPLTVITKKGIINQNKQEVIDLGCGWTEDNVIINSIIYPNEIYENGQIKPLDNSNLGSAAIEFDCNGKKYYFRKSLIQSIDKEVKYFTDQNVNVVFILICVASRDQRQSPYFMTYPGVRDFDIEGNGKSKCWAINTANEYGLGYFSAVMEFLAMRYSYKNNRHGHVERFVIGNEIDASCWNAVDNYDKVEPLPLEDYVEEYARTVRIAEQATKKYYKNNKVLLSLTHFWNGASPERGCYQPKQILDYFNKKVKAQGNFDWGMAAHPYAVDLLEYNFLYEETTKRLVTNDIENTYCITWTNLELLDVYFKQDDLLFNGQVRKVYLTEGGCPSGIYGFEEMAEPLQAAGIAYAYYKAMMLDCIDAFIYYKMTDSPSGDGAPSATYGLFQEDGKTKKLSYELFQYLDTQYTFDIAEIYLKYVKVRKGKDVLSYGNGFTTYKEIMDLYDSPYDFENEWQEEKMIFRTATEKPGILS